MRERRLWSWTWYWGDVLLVLCALAFVCASLALNWIIMVSAISSADELLVMRPIGDLKKMNFARHSKATIAPTMMLSLPPQSSSALPSNHSENYIVVAGKRIPRNKWHAFQQRLECLSENSSFSLSSSWFLMKYRPLLSYGRPEALDYNSDKSFTRSFVAHNQIVDEPLHPGQHGFMYAWIPRGNCSFSSLGSCRNPRSDRCAFDAVKSARAMRGRPLLVVGDSTQFTLHNVLLSMFHRNYLGDMVRYHSQFQPCAHQLVPKFAPNVSSFEFRYVRNDWLLYKEEDARSAHSKAQNVYAYAWFRFMKNDTVLFINQGLHFRPTVNLIVDLRDMLTNISAQYPGALVVFRNTHLPRTDQQTTDTPVGQYPPLPIKEDHLEWGWQSLYEQNRQVEAFLKAEFPQVIFLRVDHMTRFRTDNRADYVHLKHPGTPDWW